MTIMKVKAVTDYLTEGYPVLHIMPDFVDGAYLHYMSDTDTAVISIKEDKFTDEEMEMLMKHPIEVGAYIKNKHLLMIAKAGPSDNPFVYTLPLDPLEEYNQPLIDKFVESRFIVLCLIDGKEQLTFRGIRVLGIPDEMRECAVNNWIDCIKQGDGYSLKYANFIRSALSNDPLDLWNQAQPLGSLEV